MSPGRRTADRIRDELQFHRDRLVADYIGSGMTREAAERRAYLEFGNVAQIEEACGDVRGRWLDDLGKDLRYALRMARRSPGFAAVAVLSLALGIGANTAIFTLINAVILRSLPVEAPDQLIQITRSTPAGRPGGVSYLLFEYFRDHLTSIAGAFAQGTADQSIVIDGEEDFVVADLVSGDYFGLLGIEAAAGRLLAPADDEMSPETPAAVISDRYWQRWFSRSPSAIGATIAIRDRRFTIVGVTPSSFQSARTGHAPDLVLPLRLTMSENQRREITNNWLHMMGRLKPGRTIEQANAEVQTLWNALLTSQAAQAPEKERDAILRQRAGAFAAPDGFNPFRYQFAQPLLILMGIVGLVLVLACVNLSGMLLARAAARQREISIRLAIGAGRARLIRQFLTESLVLAAGGGAAGLAIAYWFSGSLVMLFANGSDVALSVAPDWRVLAFTAGVSLVACVVAGLAPALQAVRVTLNPSLKEVRTAGHSRFGKALVVVQLAISMVLIVGATLFVGTLARLYAVDRGIDTRGLLVVTVRASQPFPAARGLEVQRRLLDSLAALPGVQAAGAAQVLPLGGGLWTRSVQVEGYAFRPDESETVGFSVISPGYFSTLATPLLGGREFDARDSESSSKVAIVNESFARYFFGSGQVIGRRVTSLDTSYEIVGVVRDAKYQTLRSAILRTVYIPWMQRDGDPPTRYNYVARAASGDPLGLVPAVERLVRTVDPALRVRSAITYETLVGRSIVTERIMATLGGVFGVLALVVAALGMFGVLAFQVARRTNELGLRMALGASRRAIAGVVFRDVAIIVAAGVALGAGLARLLTGLARNLLFGLTPGDPVVFVAAAAVLTLAAGVAGWLPAHRASRVDPLVALRHE